MDGSRFDTLARSLTATHSRRGLSRLLGAVTLAGPFALLGLAETEAKRKKVTLCYQGQMKTVSKKAKKTYLKRGATLGACPPAPDPPPPLCPQPAAPHWCASANTCVPACPPNRRFDPASCECRCVPQIACGCRAGTSNYCVEVSHPGSGCTESCLDARCDAACAAAAVGGREFERCGGSITTTAVCNADGGCGSVCVAVQCGDRDYCRGDTGLCGQTQDGVCHTPLGGGPSRCVESAGIYGCSSHQDCADQLGVGAVCVVITGSGCTCGGSSTFCARPR